jgi:ubiquinone/menaquinone biosynthesis C-methylase UbiE
MTIPGFFEGTGMPDAGWWEALWPEPAKVLSAVGVRPGMDVVDLCCGDGWFTRPLAKVARHVIAIDIDARLLGLARKRLAESGATNCMLVEADAYDIAKLVSEPVDHVFLANAFHGVPDKARLSRAVRSVLKPGGLFAVVNWHARPREETVILGEPRGPATIQRMTPHATIAGVAPSGLKLRDVVEVPPYHYGAVFERVD